MHFGVSHSASRSGRRVVFAGNVHVEVPLYFRRFMVRFSASRQLYPPGNRRHAPFVDQEQHIPSRWGDVLLAQDVDMQTAKIVRLELKVYHALPGLA